MSEPAAEHHQPDNHREAVVLHLAVRSDWHAAQASGWYQVSTRGARLDEVGFIHCSTTGQLPGVLARFYADLDPATLAVIVLDAGAIAAAGSPVRWEQVPASGVVPDASGGDSPGQSELFPHVYGPIPTAAALAVLPLPGRGALPDLSGPDPTGFDAANARR